MIYRKIITSHNHKSNQFFLWLWQVFFYLFLCLQNGYAQEIFFQIPSQTEQIILVITESWEATEGKLYFIEKLGKKWKNTDKPIEISVGRNGLAWGIGLFPEKSMTENTKKEGDGKSPAGIFELTTIFGYEQPNISLKMPFIRVDTSWICVDDMDSQYYNQVIQPKNEAVYPQSFEKMLRNDEQYRWGIIVAHNPKAESGAGSCIFLHIWKSEKFPTSGCTAMQETDVWQIITKLETKKKPILIQLPQEIYQKHADIWRLPIKL